MSFDGYAEHIFQKYRLSIAVAVLKTKPPDISTPDYISLLQSKAADKMDTDNLSICSEDFRMDENDDNLVVLEDFHDGEIDYRNIDERVRITNDGTQASNVIMEKITNLGENLTQTTYYSSSQTQLEPNIDKDITYYETYNTNNTQNHEQDGVLKTVEAVKLTKKGLEPGLTNIITSNSALVSKESNTKHSNNNEQDSFYDTQKTILYTVPNFTQNYTHYSPSQNDIFIPHRYLFTTNNKENGTTVINNRNNNNDTNTKHKNITEIYSDINNNSDKVNLLNEKDLTNTNNKNDTDAKYNDVTKAYSKNINLTNEKNLTETKNKERFGKDYFSNVNTYENIKTNNNYESKQEMNLFSQNVYDVNNSESILKNVNGLPESNTDYSQNDHNYLKEIDNFNNKNIFSEFNNKNTVTAENENPNINDFSGRNSDYSQNVQDYFKEIKNLNRESHFEEIDDENTTTPKIINSKDTFAMMQTATHFSHNNETSNFVSQNTFINSKESANSGNHINEDNSNKIIEKQTQNLGPHTDITQEDNKEISYEIIEEECETEEVVPYKVLEELNKVKMYLRKRDRRLSCDLFSTDSGYRSDSQLRSSNRCVLQLSLSSINQSAYSLLNYLLQCPLQVATRKITGEIAQTFGQLIDRLHEEENYPPFLEELLDTIDNLLNLVSKSQSCEDSEFLKKDECIQRILLLNKSIHIQKHTIEKINCNLIKFHEKITDENNTYELTNIDEVENVSYIFHILEILLKKYIKNKDILSQNSQLSQDEDTILKKSSITEIWRKKWNPNFKENSVGSRESRCILKSCSEMLNNIIVDCVNSYSLVAYSALKCFNCINLN